MCIIKSHATHAQRTKRTNRRCVVVSFVMVVSTMAQKFRLEKRWRMVKAYLQDVNASRSCIARKAYVSFALVERWLPVYKRTGDVVDDTKPGPRKGMHHHFKHTAITTPVHAAATTYTASASIINNNNK